MGLEINKIDNEALKALAKKADTVEPEKEYLDENEISVFNDLVEKALKAGNAGFENKDYADVVGLMTTPNAKINLTEKEKEALLINKVRSYVNEGYTRDAIMYKLEEEKVNLPSAKLMAVLNAMSVGKNKKGEDVQLTYNKHSDIADNRTEVKRAMESAGVDTNEWHEVRKLLEDAIYNELYEKAITNIDLAVFDLMAADLNLSYKDALKQVEKNFRKDGLTSDKVYKKAFKDSSNPMKAEAYDLVRKEFAKYYGNVEEQKQRALREKIYDDLKKQRPDLKEYLYSATLGNSFLNRITGKPSQGKLAAQAVTNYNKVLDKYIQTEEEIKDALGKKREQIFTAMKTMMTEKLNENGYPVDNAGNEINAKGQAVNELGDVLYDNAKPAMVPLIKQTEDGKWDISQLSLLLANELGRGDHELSRHNKKIDSNTCEINRAKGKLANLKDKDGNSLEDLLKSGNLTEADTKKLIKLCGFPKEKADAYKIILGTVIGAAVGLASGAGAEATTKRSYKVAGREFHDTINIDLNGMSITQDQLPEGVTLIGTGVDAYISIEKIINIPGYIVNLSKMVDTIALKSAILPAIMGALAAIYKHDGEFEVTGAHPTEDNIEAYAERMKKENPEYAELIVMIASTFVKDGEWQKEEYSRFIDTQRGTEGKLNKKEFSGMIEARIRQIQDLEKAKKENDSCKETPCNARVERKDTPAETQDVDNALEYKVVAGDTWAGIVKTYYPCLEKRYGLWGKNGAIRKLKVALAGGDKAKLKKLLEEGNLPEKMILPSMIEDCPREDGNEKVTVAIKRAETEEEKEAWKGSTLKSVGKNEPDKIVINEAKTEYIATDECTNKKGIGATVLEAFNMLKELTGKIYSNEAEFVK